MRKYDSCALPVVVLPPVTEGTNLRCSGLRLRKVRHLAEILNAGHMKTRLALHVPSTTFHHSRHVES